MAPVTEIEAVKDSAKTHWVNRAPVGLRPYLQLSRLDRPVGYWLLALPGWIGLTFAGLSQGLAWVDLVWAALILVGAIAMRGAGCTYNDIVDQDLDAQVERTALRPLPAGTVTTRQAWRWTFAQIGIGFLVWLCLPLLAKGIALLALPLVAAYPFMKRITWFPQVWLGLTLNWAVLVAYAIKTGEISLPVLILYLGLMFWTVGYDTIYACQDMEDDAMAGIKSTALRFGGRVRLGVGICYTMSALLILHSAFLEFFGSLSAPSISFGFQEFLIVVPFFVFFMSHLFFQLVIFKPADGSSALKCFKSNTLAGVILVLSFVGFGSMFSIFVGLVIPHT